MKLLLSHLSPPAECGNGKILMFDRIVWLLEISTMHDLLFASSIKNRFGV